MTPSARLLSGPQRPIVLMPRRPRRADRRRGGAAQPRPRRHAGLHAAARICCSGCRATSRAARAGDDVRQSRRRADLLHRRRCARTAFASRRRLADARSGHPGALRRLRRAGVSSTGPTMSSLPIRRSRGYAPLPIALPVSVPPTLAVGADLKNTMAVADGQIRLAEPAHRRHGRPGDAVRVRLGATAPARR